MPKRLSQRMAEDGGRVPFDAVVLEHCYAIEALPRLPSAAVVVDDHNIESDCCIDLSSHRFAKNASPGPSSSTNSLAPPVPCVPKSLLAIDLDLVPEQIRCWIDALPFPRR